MYLQLYPVGSSITTTTHLRPKSVNLIKYFKMDIVNPKRKTRIKEFRDKDHGVVMDRYYEMLNEQELDNKTATEMLLLTKEDPDFYDPYLVTAEYLESQGQYEESKKLARTAYERAVKRIVDDKGNFPKFLPWGYLENRHIIRAIGNQARTLWEEGDSDGALNIFKKLLEANPNDNTGCRFDILAIKLGLKPNFLEKAFSAPGQKGMLDAGRVENWFEQNVNRFPEEFKTWFESKRG